MKYSDFAIEQLKSRLAEKVMKDSTPKKCAGDMLEALEVIKQLQEQNRWISCSERLPDRPEENPVFEYKSLELYLISVKDADYPIRAFWNGKYFTDGWSKVDVIAWMPLPEPYKEQN